jgi:CoA:oxalate CoA-transferase
MAATMLSMNERAGALLSEIDTDGEPIILSASDSHIFQLPGDRRLTIAGSSIYTPMFQRFCAMMRRNDLLTDPRFATAKLRRQNLADLLAEVRAWITTFSNFEQLQVQVSEAGDRRGCGAVNILPTALFRPRGTEGSNPCSSCTESVCGPET